MADPPAGAGQHDCFSRVGLSHESPPRFRRTRILPRSGSFGLYVAKGPEHCESVAPGSRTQLYPRRSMIAGAFKPAHMPVDACVNQPARRFRAEQEMVETHTGIALPSVPHVVPEGINRV